MKPIRYGIIGLKGIGRAHLRLVQRDPLLQMTAVADIDAEEVKARSNALGVPGYTDYRALLDADLVDAVTLALPHYLHAEIGLACMNAGLHVLLEKPLANRVSEADALLAAAKANGVKIAVGHQGRFHRSAQAIKSLIVSGRLGSIHRVLWTWMALRGEPYYKNKPWRATWREAGGGVLMNQASHALDLICWLVGRPVQVSALMANQMHQAEIEDIVSASVRFESGALASIQMTTNQPHAYNVRQLLGDRGLIVIPDTSSLVQDGNDQILFGQFTEPLPDIVRKGQLAAPIDHWETIKLPRLQLLPAQCLVAVLERFFSRSQIRRWDWQLSGRLRRRPILSNRGGFDAPGPARAQLLHDFAEAIRDDREPLVSGASCLPVIELINGIILSAVSGKTISLPLDRDQYDYEFERLALRTIKTPT